MTTQVKITNESAPGEGHVVRVYHRHPAPADSNTPASPDTQLAEIKPGETAHALHVWDGNEIVIREVQQEKTNAAS
jgi:hypothetical protein